MKLPQLWIFERPGILIPVFFFGLVPTHGQLLERECAAAALGNTFLTRSGYCLPGQNQAGLGQIAENSISLQHSRPALCPDLGISSISVQWVRSHGAIGTMISNYGIRGLGFTSAWLAYGLAFRKGWNAGVGIHFWHATIREKWLHHPCISFAVGIQAAMNDRLTLAAHVSHPAGWYSSHAQFVHHPMTITVGGSWMILPMISSFWEAEVSSGYPVRWKLGFEWKECRGWALQIGAHDQPFTVSGGIAVNLTKWIIHVAFAFRVDRGSTPYTSLSYVW